MKKLGKLVNKYGDGVDGIKALEERVKILEGNPAIKPNNFETEFKEINKQIDDKSKWQEHQFTQLQKNLDLK